MTCVQVARRTADVSLVAMRMLIVDDDELVVKLLARVCGDDGHEVRVSTSPQQALEDLFEHTFDLLITDLAMPGLDGVTLAREARRLQPHILTLIITGHARASVLDDILKDGHTDVIFKPFHMNELRARVGLAEQRKRVLDALREERNELQSVSNEMIDGLQTEIDDLRARKTPTGPH